MEDAATTKKLITIMEKVLTCLLICLPILLCQKRTPIVQLDDGSKVQGAVGNAQDGKFVSEYLGIPYAQPPVGDRRFEVPLPTEPWHHILNATSMPKSCYQMLENGKNVIDMTNSRPDIYELSEDCLYLNIWVPQTLSSHPLPVTFYVHGGSFVKGSSAQNVHNGKFLAAEMDTIVVTFNYRLAVFGFFYTGIHEYPANMGIRDQIEAFRWVVKNIRAFGGDPEKITLVGNSAGAASVGFLSTIPDIQSKVSRMIMYSGVPNAPWASHDRYKALSASMRLVKQVNCTRDMIMSTMAINCLKTIDPSVLVKYSTGEGGSLSWTWKPVVDEHIVKLDQVISNNRSIDILIGTTSNEAGSFVGRMLSEKPNRLPSDALKFILRQEIKKLFPDVHVPAGYFDEIFQTVMHLYGPPNNGEFNYTYFVSALNNIASDYLFNCPADRFAKHHVKHGHTVYKYVFDHMVSTK
uniref:Carboxylic ester hydrolase n=1 Tax=Romanomermis culicivorax TaxID=13658 RepID=A0A915KFV0_ROMCU